MLSTILQRTMTKKTSPFATKILNYVLSFFSQTMAAPPLQKLLFAKVAPLGVNPEISFEKGESIHFSKCPSKIFLAKKGYELTTLQFLTTVPPSISEANVKEQTKSSATKSESQIIHSSWNSTLNANEFCSGDFNVSCGELITGEIEGRKKKKKSLKKIMDRFKQNKISPS